MTKCPAKTSLAGFVTLAPPVRVTNSDCSCTIYYNFWLRQFSQALRLRRQVVHAERSTSQLHMHPASHWNWLVAFRGHEKHHTGIAAGANSSRQRPRVLYYFLKQKKKKSIKQRSARNEVREPSAAGICNSNEFITAIQQPSPPITATLNA